MLKRKQNRIWALYIILALLAIVFVVVKRESFSSFAGEIFRILRPVLIGAILAYLCNPIFRMFERRVFSKVHSFTLRRTLSLIGTYLVLALIFVLLLLLIIPQLLASVIDFLENYETLLATALENINGLLTKVNENLNLKIPPVKLETISQGFDWIVKNININELMDRFLSGNTILVVFEYIGDTLYVLTDIIFGLFISLYMLAGKEKIYAQIMRMRKSLFNNRINERITRICTIADRSFGGFLRGKILDSTIVGFLVYIIISIMEVPYALLIAVLIGITDIVPVVGPFIGVIPAAVIILLTDPVKVIPFLLTILVVQQIDGNIIGPKILGENTGVSSLCVMISITVMGAIWGLVGMVLGVPLFATIVELTNEFLNKRLEAKGMPTEVEEEIPEKKKSRPKKERACLSDGYGPLTEQEKTRLLAFSLVSKYDLYAPQGNATLAACVGEYLDTTRIAEALEDETQAYEALASVIPTDEPIVLQTETVEE